MNQKQLTKDFTDYVESQVEAGLIPSSFDVWLEHELANRKDEQ